MQVDDLLDLLSDDPIRRYRDSIEYMLNENRNIVLKCSKKLRYRVSEKDRRALVRKRRKSTDKITEYIRFLDPKGQIAGLKAKGKAKKDTTGFVVRGVINEQRFKKE